MKSSPLTKTTICLCLLCCVLLWAEVCRAEPDSTAGVEAFTFRLWFCLADDKGAGTAAAYLFGELVWDRSKDILTVTTEASQRLLWVPSEWAKKAGASCPLGEIKRCDVSVRREDGNVWRTEPGRNGDGDGDSSSGEDADIVMFGLAPLLFPALEHKSQVEDVDLDMDVVSKKGQDQYVVNPCGVRHSFKPKDQVKVSSEAAFIREAHPAGTVPAADVVFVRVGEDRICAVTARIWSGGVALMPDEKALAVKDTIQQARMLLGMDWGGKDLYKDRLETFLKELVKSHPGNNVLIGILELRPAPVSGGFEAPGVDEDDGEGSGDT